MFECFNGFYEWVNDNPDKIDPYLCAVYFAILNRANKSGWKESFAIILVDLQEDCGINSRTTMLKTLGRLEEFGLIKTISKTQNQYKNRVICLPLNGKHLDSTWKPNEKHVKSTWTHNKTIKIDKTIEDYKEEIEEKPTLLKKNETAWWKKATRQDIEKKIEPYINSYPASFITEFVDYYSSPNEDGGININQLRSFEIESHLRKWWSDPKTKTKHTTNTQRLPDEITSKPNEELAERIERAKRYVFARKNTEQGD